MDPTKFVLAVCGAVILAGCEAKAPLAPLPARPVVTEQKVEPPKPAPDLSKRFSFKQDTPGVMTLAQYRTKYEDDADSPLILGKTVVEGTQRLTPRYVSFTIAGERVEHADFVFVDEVLAEIALSIGEDSKSVVLDALTEAYGKPVKTGAFNQWSLADGMLQISHFHDEVRVRFDDIKLREVLDARIDDAAAREKARKSKDL